MTRITYTGTEPVEQPSLGLSWEPGQVREVGDDVAASLAASPGSPFRESAEGTTTTNEAAATGEPKE